MAEPAAAASDRRRLERRTNPTLAELTLPELRRMLVTTMLLVIVLALFLWMVRTVIIAAILGVIVAAYLRPPYRFVLRRVRLPIISAGFTLALIIVPLLLLLSYSYLEIADRATYISQHQDEIAARIDTSLRRLPFLQEANTEAAVKRYVIAASNYGATFLTRLRATVASLAVAGTVFLFTAFYVVIDAERILQYIRDRIPARYAELSRALESNVQGVLYGAIYSTFLTQGLKSAIILAMNVMFQVPLAGVLAIVSFIIGFFPIVGSWSVYLPVSAWLWVFRDSPAQAAAMLGVGILINTLYISTYLRPKIAAERSRVLNFYWMLVALVTGVYTFGIVGILLGPMLIGLLKAILDTITSAPAWEWADAVEEELSSESEARASSSASEASGGSTVTT